MEEALARFREALRIHPAYYLARYNEGEALYRLGRREEALASLTEAHRLRPWEIQPPVAVGEVLEETGAREEAARWFRKALAIDPSNGYAMEGLARNGRGVAAPPAP